jgi:hypothetical protein
MLTEGSNPLYLACLLCGIPFKAYAGDENVAISRRDVGYCPACFQLCVICEENDYDVSILQKENERICKNCFLDLKDSTSK